jgi:hypothetical protein
LLLLSTFSVMGLCTLGCHNSNGGADSGAPVAEPSDASSDRHSEEGRVRAERHAFSLIPPQGWSKENTPPNILTFRGPVDHGFAANFTVGADPYSGRPPVEDLPARLKAELPPQFTVLDEGFTTVDEKKTFFVRTSVTTQGLQLINVQYFFPSDRTMYSISFASTAEAFDRHKATLQSVLDSVHAD